MRRLYVVVFKNRAGEELESDIKFFKKKAAQEFGKELKASGVAVRYRVKPRVLSQLMPSSLPLK
jgi:hypothetical protein